MNNLLNTEKALKHWLKNKVTVTTATVVGFLIMGTVSFGAEIIDDSGLTTYENTKEINEESTNKGLWVKKVKDGAESFTLTNSSNIKNKHDGANGILVEKAVKKINIINNENGNIEAIADSGHARGIYSVSPDTTITNNGNIVVKNKTNNATGIDFTGENINITNKKDINVVSGEIKETEKTGNLAVGISILSKKFTIINEGKIDVVSNKTNATGIEFYSVEDDSTIENSGTISAKSNNGASAHAIFSQVSVPKDKKVTITNTDKGKLIGESVRNNISSGAVVKLINNGEGKIIFNNNGEINVSKGTAVAISGKNIEVNNTGTIVLEDNNTSDAFSNYSTGTIKSNGQIIINKTSDELKNFDINSIINGQVTIGGQILNAEGKEVTSNPKSKYIGGPLSTLQINEAGKELQSVTLGKQAMTKITNETPESIKLNALNIIGEVGVVENSKDGEVNNTPIIIENTTVNFDANGKFIVGGNVMNDKDKVTGAELSIKNNTVNKFEKGVAIELTNKSTLNLTDVTFNGGITSDINKGNIVNVYGKTSIDGEINVEGVNVGNDITKSNDILTLSSNSKFTRKDGTLLYNRSGMTVFNIGANGENALKNSTGTVQVSGNIDFDTTNLTSDTTVELNNKDKNVTHDLSGVTYTNKTTGVYTTNLDRTNNILDFAYNRNLFKDARLNAINNEAQIVNDKFSQVESERESQIDKLYSGSIYAETVRASYDNLKLNERTILSLNNDVKAGEFRAEGKAIYGKDEYKREGVVGRYDVENETSGLLASLEYGLTDTTKTGLVFAGSKQDLDVAAGNADGDLFYLGLYGVKSVGNYDFTAGLGYQLGKYEANNTAANVLGTDKYDTEAISGYVQAKYLGDLGRGLSIQPKVKLGYTYLKQDDVKDSYFGLTDAEVKTFDTELGADLVKTVKFEKSTLDIKLGTAFVKTFGDTDKAFKGQFFGAKTTSNQFDVLGAGLSENVLKFNLGAEVENENGFFYNGGFTYEFGSENMESYGANVGIGYRF